MSAFAAALRSPFDLWKPQPPVIPPPAERIHICRRCDTRWFGTDPADCQCCGPDGWGCHCADVA